MGSCCCTSSAWSNAATIELVKEDSYCEDEESASDKIQKVLLLGSDSVGKSVVFRRLSGIQDALDDAIKAETLATIRSSCAAQMLKLLQAMAELIETQLLPPMQRCDLKLAAHFSVLSECEENEELAESELCAIGLAVAYFWSLESVRRTHALRFGRFAFKENMEKFFDKALEVFSEDYELSTEDSLMVPRSAHGVVECKCTNADTEPKTFTLVDACQTRSKDQKWVHALSNVDVVLFVAALDNFNCVNEDGVNCMHHSLQQFDDCLNHKVLRDKNVILVLNNSDRFRDLLKAGHSLSACFGRDAEDWEGPEFWDTASLYDYNAETAAAMTETQRNAYFDECCEKAMAFIDARYKEKNICDSELRIVLVNHVTATDEDIAQKVFLDLEHFMLRDIRHRLLR